MKNASHTMRTSSKSLHNKNRAITGIEPTGKIHKFTGAKNRSFDKEPTQNEPKH